MASTSKTRKAKGKAVATTHINLTVQLLEAVQQGKTKIVKRLLDNRIDTNCVTEGQETPLLLAASLKDRDASKAITNLLLDRGCLVNTCNTKGQTALLSAINMQDYELVVTLLEKGSDVGLADHEGNTPLCIAAKTGNADIVQKVLSASLKNRISVDHRNMRGLTALLIATQGSHLQAAKILVEKGKASLTIRDLENFMTPEDWMKETSCYNSSELFFLSPKMRHKRNRKAIKTLSDYMNDDLPHTESPNVYEFDKSSSIKLPHIATSTGLGLGRSMFEVASVKQSPKSTALSLGRVVPLPQQTKFRLSAPLLLSTSSGSYHTVYGSKKAIRRSGFYSEGSLEPLIPPVKASFTKQGSVMERRDHIKQIQPLPLLKHNHNNAHNN